MALPDESLRLPAASIPDGCRDWTTSLAADWSAALPPRWTFLRVRRSVAAGLATLVLCVGALVAMAGGLWPFVAAGFAVYVLWVLARPELVWVGAPLLLLALAAEASSMPWALTGFGVVVVLGSWAVVAVRLRARGEQLERAVAAAGGIAVPVPGAGAPVRRGRLLFGLGSVVLALGVLTGSTAGLWGSAEDQEGAWVFTVFLAGLGATALTSGWLGRQRAGALRGAPVPVLRVLVRDDAQGSTEVYAADDLSAERPLFTVELSSFDEDDEDDEDDEVDEVDEVEGYGGEDGDGPAGGDGDDELRRVLLGLDDDTLGPVREAVVYGAPFDGAEILVVSADEDPEQPPLTEWSAGPVRPLSPDAGRKRAARHREQTADSLQLELQGRELAEQRATVGQVRRWRAGWLDWLATAFLVQWGLWLGWGLFDEPGLSMWNLALITLIGLYGAVRVPMKLAWRVTADRSGVWVPGLRGPRHVPWDDLRFVRRRALELKIDWQGGDWTVSAPRWGRLQRRRGLTHPYDALAAELTAMRLDAELRPTGESGAAERGRPLWPMAAVLAVVWVAVLVAAR
ncbi:hypothetical protein ACKI1I_18345 [Streptomyces turgidiscabies]|uniref:Putative membrane protein n=1 Tax=Streptomyces turgidiscabies (strain Car8) TaxID=698760 RepID=L7EQ33_STRT8|nr:MULTISPECIES: hypothetical protein [Streptomyces]ELP61568.1 putative membrane protein [Streptomyces turgidiscabies Car8]MDX3497920.1 hypothetical protein [Streptomyces turgidiscabies]GAQ69828.1 hypothetical protein T45_01559 [Streptomyces turgidiscabies]